jgi:hypothetical protein
MALKIIICFLDVLINDFSDVDEAMFQVFNGLFQLGFCIPGIEKRDFEEVA